MGDRDAGRAVPPRASVSSPEEGDSGLSAIRWGSKPGPTAWPRHPAGSPRPGPGPPAHSLHPSLAPREGLRALLSYQPRSLAQGLPWCRGLPHPQGPKAPGDPAPARKEVLVSPRLLSGLRRSDSKVWSQEHSCCNSSSEKQGAVPPPEGGRPMVQARGPPGAVCSSEKQGAVPPPRGWTGNDAGQRAPGAVCPRVRACSDQCWGPSWPSPSGPVAQRLPRRGWGDRPPLLRDTVFGSRSLGSAGLRVRRQERGLPCSSPGPLGPPGAEQWRAASQLSRPPHP